MDHLSKRSNYSVWSLGFFFYSEGGSGECVWNEVKKNVVVEIWFKCNEMFFVKKKKNIRNKNGERV